jgi:hypothetical protein
MLKFVYEVFLWCGEKIAKTTKKLIYIQLIT